MIIEISPNKVVPGAITVWSHPGPEVDIVMDPKYLTFREGSVKELYAFKTLDHFFLEEIPLALSNWHKCLAPGSEAYILVDDFEVIARAFVGGDIDITKINEEFAHPTYFTRDNLIATLKAAGFTEDKIHIWFQGVPGKFQKGEHDLVIAAKK